MSNDPILVVADRTEDGEGIKQLLEREFDKVFLCDETKRHVSDFELYKPAVLVLAFNEIRSTEIYLQALQRPSLLVTALPYCVLGLCSRFDLARAYELCREGALDDYLLYWPKSEDPQRVRLAVHQALKQVAEARACLPSAREFAALARRLTGLDELLDVRLAGTQQQEAPPQRDAARALQTLAARRRPLILIVDDDRFQHKLLAQVLLDVDAELTFAASATKGLLSLRRRPPDLVLMDVGLPDITGVEATRLLKSTPQFAAIPVVMITGTGGRDSVMQSLKAGAVDFVVKPIDKAILLGKVRRLLTGATSS